MPCSTAVKLPPTTTWPTVGLLCLCSCTSPVFVGTDEENTSTGVHAASETSGVEVTMSAPTDGTEADTEASFYRKPRNREIGDGEKLVRLVVDAMQMRQRSAGGMIFDA